LIAACDANGASVRVDLLDAGLIHLLYRALGVMGLPPRHSAQPPASPNAVLNALHGRLRNPGDPAAIELQRIVSSAQG